MASIPRWARRSCKRAGGRRGLGLASAAWGTLCPLALALALEARADTFYVQAGGVEDAVGCTEPGCSLETFALDAAAEVFGRIEIDTGLPVPTLSFELDQWFDPASLVETVPGTEDNGVAAIDFTGVTYTAVDLPLTESSPGSGSFSVDFGATATLEGDQTQWDDLGFAVNGTPAFFSDPDVLVTGNCLVVAPGSASCSLSFGTSGFELDVGDPLPAPRSLRHTLGLVLLPEPGEWWLLAAGLVALPLLGRSRMRH
jgi:hypothetical protein